MTDQHKIYEIHEDNDNRNVSIKSSPCAFHRNFNQSIMNGNLQHL